VDANTYLSVVFSAATRDSPDVDIAAEDVDDAVDFLADADVTSRVRTTASVNWSDTDLGTGSHIDSPSITTVIDEIQARGAASGYNICILADGSNLTPPESGCRTVAYDGTPADAAILHIEYTPFVPPTPEVVTVAADTTPTHWQSRELTVNYSDPLWFDNRQSLQRLDFSTYSHELRAIGGYYSLKLSIDDDELDINDWIDGGIGRHIVSYNPELEVIGEYFVNKVTATIGSLQFSVGPLIAIGNRLKVRYSVVDTTVDPPVTGEQTETAVANNDDSQALFGIIEKVLNVNSATSTEAEQIRDSVLNDVSRAFPATSRKSTLGGSPARLTLDCLGYWHWLDTYLYNNSATGQVNLSDKIIAILAAESNGIFSTLTDEITSNTTQVQDGEDKDKKAVTILKYLNSLGDSNNNRYNMGFYQDRKFRYEVAPSEVEYHQRITGDQGITTPIGGKVDPWNVLPAKWLFYPDFLVGRHPPISNNTLQRDPRTGFIEVVKFTLPDSLSINGSKLDESDVLLERLGLKGSA